MGQCNGFLALCRVWFSYKGQKFNIVIADSDLMMQWNAIMDQVKYSWHLKHNQYAHYTNPIMGVLNTDTNIITMTVN